MSNGITAHMVVKNEDKWVRYSILSVLPYVDQFLITDTGSTDKTLDIIKSINSKKIILTQKIISSRSDIAKIRTNQIKATKTDWMWIVDADEIYTESGASEVVAAVKLSKHSLIVVRRYDLLGDIYHRQVETVGAYDMFGQSGHLLIRLLNISQFPGLEVKGDYPLESYFFGKNCVNDLPRGDVYITANYLYHAMYLKRSSLGGNLPMFNRSKYMIELGIKIDSLVPKLLIGQPKRSLLYELIAALITPIKTIKRSFKAL